MKKFLMVIVAIFSLLLCFSSMASAASANYYSTPYEGVVISTQTTARKAPEEKAEKFGSLKNSQTVWVIGEIGNYYIIDLNSTNFSDDELTETYCSKDFIILNPYYVELPVEMNILAAPWDGAKANAQKTAGTQMLVISENNDWLAVQCRDDSAGSGFIHKSWLNWQYWGNNSWNYTNPTVNIPVSQGNTQGNSEVEAVVIAPQSLRVKKEANDESKTLGFLHTNDRVVKVGGESNGYQGIKYEYCGATVLAYVHSEYLMDVYE